MRYFRHISVASAIAAVLASGAAYAQAGEGEAGDAGDSAASIADDSRIVVTASKVGAQELQEAPLAIQVFDGEDLRERNITTIGDLVSAVPGAQEGFRQSNASRFYNLRGNVTQNGDSPIGYYLDDTPFIVTNFGIAPPVRFIDMERVEVLRGPHGTLYGQGSSGGVFIFHTRDPDLRDFEYTFEAEASATRGASDLNYGMAGAVSIPVAEDMLAFRVSGGFSRDAGYADVYYGAFDGTPDETDVNSAKNDDLRVVALFKPSDNVTIRGQYWNFRPRQNFTGFTASVDPVYFENTAGQDGFSNGDFTLWSLTATVDFDAFSVTSATSNLEGEFGINIPISPAGSFSSQFFPKMFAQEVRVNSTGDGPFNWLIGASYQNGSGPQENALQIPPFVNINADNDTLTENWAVFGEVSYELLDGKLIPLAGIRTYHDDRSFRDGTGTVPTKASVETWRLNLTYLPNDNLTMFVSAATGFRPGIVQSRVQVESLELAGVPATVALDPESSKNYEFGLKWRTSDDTLNVGLNLYRLEYTNLQTSVTGGIDGVNGFANFGDATTQGIDLELRWRTPVDGLSLGFVGNINDSEYDTVNEVIAEAQPLLRPGARLINTLSDNWRIDANYNTGITPDWDGFGNVSFSHSGDRLQASGIVANPYNLVNFTAGVRSDNWEVALIGNNLFDERGPTFVGNNGPLSGSGPTPRTIGLRVRLLSY